MEYGYQKSIDLETINCSLSFDYTKLINFQKVSTRLAIDPERSDGQSN